MRKFINFLIKREQSRTGSGFAECEKSRLKAKLTMTLALLITAVTGAWAQGTYTITFAANSNTKTVENVTLPKTYQCSYNNADGELDLILKELYGWTGDKTFCDGETTPNSSDENKVVAGNNNGDHYITINNVFEGTVTITGNYCPQTVVTPYTLEISIAATAPAEWPLTSQDGTVWTLAKMPANDVELQVEYEPTKVTMAVNDKTMGTAEVAGESKVEWTADTWKGWTTDKKELTVDDITITSSDGSIYNYTYDYSEGKYKNSLSFLVSKWDNSSTVTFSTTGDPFSRIEFTMIDNYSENNPNIMPNDNWTFEGKNAVWEGKATKSLTLQSCSTFVSKITFFKGAIPDGVTINGDGTFTVAKTATVTLKATPAEGYKFLYWEDDQTKTNPVREVTIESGMADKTYKAVFAEITYNVTFVEGTNPDPENPEWTATPNPAKTKQTVTVTYSGSKKVIGVKVEKKKEGAEAHALSASAVGEIVGSDGKAYAVADKDDLPSGVTAVAMVASKSGSNGLAIQLNSNSEKMKWAQAKTYAEGLTAVSGGTWRMPSKADWQNMFLGCAVSGDASASDDMNPIAGFKAKIAATGITWQSQDYWTSTEGDSMAWIVGVNLKDSSASAYFGQIPSDFALLNVLACLAF